MHHYLRQSATLTGAFLLFLTAAIAPARSEQSSPLSSPLNTSSVLAQAESPVEPSPATNAPAEEWQEFTSQQGNFSVLMPGEPEADVAPADTESGTTESGAFLLELEGDTLGYGVFYKNFPDAPSAVNAEQTQEFLDSFRDDFIKNGVLDGNLVGERDLTLGDYAGRELEVSGSEGYIKLRVYLVEERLYLLLAASETQETFPEASDRFFNSFQLLANRTIEN